MARSVDARASSSSPDHVSTRCIIPARSARSGRAKRPVRARLEGRTSRFAPCGEVVSGRRRQRWLRSASWRTGRRCRRFAACCMRCWRSAQISISKRCCSRIVESAVELVGARYGALGILDEAGVGLAQFLTVGVDDDIHHAIGHLPEGHGILGVLIADPRPLRLPRPVSPTLTRSGFRLTIRRCSSFLGVPIKLRDQRIRQPVSDRQGRRRRVQ